MPEKEKHIQSSSELYDKNKKTILNQLKDSEELIKKAKSKIRIKRFLSLSKDKNKIDLAYEHLDKAQDLINQLYHDITYEV